MSRICMEPTKSPANNQMCNFDLLKSRFPEISDEVIAQTLRENPNNLEMCVKVLSEESERLLYGEVEDNMNSRLRAHSSTASNDAFAEPLSIKIPETPHGPVVYLPHVRPVTVGQSSSMTPSNTHVSGNQGERQPSVDEYNQALIQHQKQRLERLKLQLEQECVKITDIHKQVQFTEEDLINKKFRVGRNPTEREVKQLREENTFLQNEIDQMTKEIDRINNGQGVLGEVPPVPFQRRPNCVTMPQPKLRPPGSRPPRRVQSFPNAKYNDKLLDNAQGMYHLDRMQSLRDISPYDEENLSPSPPADPSLERGEWIWVNASNNTGVPCNSTPGHAISMPALDRSQSEIPTLPNNNEEKPWSCRHCTFENHGALVYCEQCNYPRS